MGVLKFMGDDESALCGPGKARASCCINNGNTAGCIYSNSGGGGGLWRHEWEVIYETQYTAVACLDIRQLS